MRHRTAIVLALTGLLGALIMTAPARCATYHGRSVDETRYQASILNNDYGQIDNVEVRFHGANAYVSVYGGARLVLILEDEEISDPRRIPAHDPRRGIMWEICVKDMRGR